MESIKNDNFGIIRTEVKDGQTVYSAYDICNVLKIENAKNVIESTVEQKDIVMIDIKDSEFMFLTVEGVTSLVDFIESVSVYDNLDSFREWLGINNVKPQPKNENIAVFENSAFGEIHTAGTPDNPLFCLTDVCKALDLISSQVARRLDKGVFSKHTLQTAGGQQLVNFVNEDGLYDVILDSRKPEAKAFRKWITSEVLPSIRKTGSYAIEKPKELQIAEALVLANKTINEYKDKINYAKGQIQSKSETINNMLPYSNYAHNVLMSEKSYTLTEISNELGYRNVNIFINLLKANRIIYKGHERYMTYADYTEKGYFTTRTAVIRINRKDVAKTSLVVTEKGREFLHETFSKNYDFGLFKFMNDSE